MANHSSAKKARKQTIKKTLVNKSRLSEIKTYIKKTLGNIKSGTKQEAQKSFVTTQSKIMKGVKKNILKLNSAARVVSKLSKKINSLV